ncbi:MAG: class I SAM-dependent methyltransferase [Nitrososphaerota archaeon]|nr:class I SAM-dependent methyltransferase [Nitrososphaerota archaeon]
MAQNYDSTFDGKFTVKFKRKILEFCKISDGDTILDVGCGNGSLINEINQKGNVKAYGIDISPNMIKECRKLYNNSNIVFEVSTGEDMPFCDNVFNMLIICCVLHHLNNPKNFFKQAHRVLKRGGVLIVGEPWFPWGVRQLTNWIVSPLIKAGDNKLFSHEKLKHLFTDNGFEIMEIYKKGTIQIIKGRKT